MKGVLQFGLIQPQMTAKKEYWQINTARIADEIRSAASDARTEEDLKMRVEPILRKSFKDIGIDIDIVAYEKATALRAKMDAVYGYLIIEYKAPGKLGNGHRAKEKPRNNFSDTLQKKLSNTDRKTRHSSKRPSEYPLTAK